VPKHPLATVSIANNHVPRIEMLWGETSEMMKARKPDEEPNAMQAAHQPANRLLKWERAT
jgi:hypothetical protein